MHGFGYFVQQVLTNPTFITSVLGIAVLTSPLQAQYVLKQSSCRGRRRRAGPSTDSGTSASRCGLGYQHAEDVGTRRRKTAEEGKAVAGNRSADDEEMLNEAMDLGVKAYLLKESASVDIASAVSAAIEGRHYISPSLTEKLLHRKDRQTRFESSNPGLDQLSPSERKILKLISESKTSKEIADDLFLSQKTIDNYRFKISEKLGLKGSYSLLKFALENKSLL